MSLTFTTTISTGLSGGALVPEAAIGHSTSTSSGSVASMSILAVAAVAAIVASSFYTAYPSAGPLFGKVSFGAIAGGAPLVKVSAAGSGSAVIAGKFGGGTPLVNASVALASYTPRAQPFVTLQAPTTIASYSFWS